jgi:hypothetical protein
MRAAHASRSGSDLSRAPDPVDPVHRAARKVLVGFFRQAHPLHHHDPPGSLREDPREERRDGAAHGMAQQDQLLPGDRVHQVGDVVQVVHEVVVAAGPDPLGVAVTAKVGSDHVVPGGGERRGDGGEAPGEIQEAVQAKERCMARSVPFEDVVPESVGDDFAAGRWGVEHGGEAYRRRRPVATMRARRQAGGYEPGGGSP